MTAPAPTPGHNQDPGKYRYLIWSVDRLSGAGEMWPEESGRPAIKPSYVDLGSWASDFSLLIGKFSAGSILWH